jgi:hypothetical protein
MAHPLRYATAQMTRSVKRRWLKTTFSRAATAFAGSNYLVNLFLLTIFCTAAIEMPGCTGTTSTGPSTGPSVVTVTLQPTRISLSLGQSQQFQATVTGTSNKSVTWSAGGVAGGTASAGTISPSGLYTAPNAMPSPPTVTITALSNADISAAAWAVVSLTDGIVVAISPTSVTVSTGAGQSFTASVTGTGAPSTAVTWSVNGIAGGNSTLGTIASNGAAGALYVAPAVSPLPPTVSITATSVADPTKSATASVTITCSATNTISPSAVTVSLAQTQAFTASFCLAAGASIAWDVNGIAGGNSTVGSITPSSANTVVYAAPIDLPSPTTVAIHATSGLLTASASVMLISNISVTVSPSLTTVQVSQRTPFAAALTGTSDTAVSWLVNGVTNGNSTVGQICQSGSNPCAPPSAPSSASVDYLAPRTAPAVDPVTVTAESHADTSKIGNAIVSVTGVPTPLSVSVSPFYAFVPRSTSTLSTRQFFVAVTGNGSTSVTWSIQSAVAGQGCGGAACGSVDGNGVFTAPAVAPSPNVISIIATSQADNTKSASATIAITSGPTIEALLPSSVMAGGVEGFPLSVHGLNFVAGSGGAGSVILLNGVARATTCATTTTYTIVLNPADVQAAATFALQISNPGSLALLSNPVPFVILPFDVSEDAISLNSSQPAASGKDITVVEPTTAAVSAPLDVDFDGLLTNGTCEVEGTPLTVTRPSSGSEIVSLCIHGNGLDPTMTYAFTGPGTALGDIPVTASVITGLFPNTMELDLQISTTTLPGVRTLFITSLNNDRAAASGILQVK